MFSWIKVRWYWGEISGWYKEHNHRWYLKYPANSSSEIISLCPPVWLIEVCSFFLELLRSCWNASGVNLDHEQGTCSLCGKIFFMSETEHACSRLCHPVFSRQKIPKNPHPRSFYLADSATGHSKCLLTSTAMCRTSSTATRCPVWLPRCLFPTRCF